MGAEREGRFESELYGPEKTWVVRAEEELSGVEKVWRGIGFLRARKKVETSTVEEVVPRALEQLDLESTPVGERDSGKIETLPDGSISIPIYEEELVVTKRTVLRERIVIRKKTVTELERVRAELLKERVELDPDRGVEVVVDEPERR